MSSPFSDILSGHRWFDSLVSTVKYTALGRGHHSEELGSSSWLLEVFPDSSQRSIVVRALAISVAILGVEYLVEVVWLGLPYWQQHRSFLADPGVPLSAFGMVFALIVLGQWGGRYVELWERARPAFDVPPDEYDARVRRSLDGLYGRDHVPFVLFVVLQLGVYSLFGSQLPAGFFHVGFLHFFAVTALYNFYRHTVIIEQVSELPLVEVDRARPTLATVADFSIVVSLNWFAALSALAVYLWVFTALQRGVILFYASSLLVLVGVGVLVFVIPVVKLQEALARKKREQLRSIDAKFEALFESCNAGDIDGDPSVALEILETQRATIEATSTWPYRLASVGQLVIGSVIPTALSVVQTVSA